MLFRSPFELLNPFPTLFMSSEASCHSLFILTEPFQILQLSPVSLQQTLQGS